MTNDELNLIDLNSMIAHLDEAAIHLEAAGARGAMDACHKAVLREALFRIHDVKADLEARRRKIGVHITPQLERAS